MKKNQEELLVATNQLHPKLQFTLEKANERGKLAFLDNYVNVDPGKHVNLLTHTWGKIEPQKLTDAGTILNFRTCDLFHCKKNIIESAVHRILRHT